MVIHILYSLGSHKRFYTIQSQTICDTKWPERVVLEELFDVYFPICPSWSTLLPQESSLNASSRYEAFKRSVAWRPWRHKIRAVKSQLVETNVYVDTILTGVDLQIFNHDIGKSMSSSLPPSKFFCFKPKILQPSSILTTGGCSENVRLFAYWHDLEGILPLCSKIKQYAASERWHFM